MHDSPDAEKNPTEVQRQGASSSPFAVASGAVSAQNPWLEAPQDEDEATEAAEALVEEFQAAAIDLATATPGQQRLQIIATVAWMRAVVDAFPDASGVTEASSELAVGCGVLAKRWWPGRLPILAFACESSEIAKEFDLADSTPWYDIAAHIDACLGATEAPPEDYLPLNWLDDAALLPAAPEPDAVLEEAYGTIARLLRSPLDQTPAAWHDTGARLQFNDSSWATLSKAAAQLRWVRADVASVRPWSEAMGRLRWLAFHRRHISRDLRRWLDPKQAPVGGWGKHLGFEPDKAARLTELHSVLRDGDRLGGPADRDILIAWLERALDMDGERLPIGRVARYLRGHEARVFDLQETDLGGGDEHRRRRLKKLRGKLKKQLAGNG